MEEENMKVLDPVCKMIIKDKNASATSNYMNTTYYFCSKECKEAFDRKPESFIGANAPRNPGRIDTEPRRRGCC